MSKAKLISRLKKYKKDNEYTYKDLADQLGYRSPMTIWNWLKIKRIPKNRYGFLDGFLESKGY